MRSSLSYSSLRGAKRRSNPRFLCGMDCFAALAMTAEPSPGTNQRQRFVAFEQIEQGAQRLAARTRQLRIVLHDAQRFVARLGDELGVDVGAGDAIAGQPALS